jgi:hypothetical protein
MPNLSVEAFAWVTTCPVGNFSALTERLQHTFTFTEVGSRQISLHKYASSPRGMRSSAAMRTRRSAREPAQNWSVCAWLPQRGSCRQLK